MEGNRGQKARMLFTCHSVEGSCATLGLEDPADSVKRWQAMLTHRLPWAAAASPVGSSGGLIGLRHA